MSDLNKKDALVIAGLHGQLRKRSCRVFPSDLRLKIEQSRSYVGRNQ